MDLIKKDELEIANQIASIVAESGVTGEKMEAIVVKILIGRALGLDYMQSIFGIDFFDVIDKRTGAKRSEIFIKPKLLASRIKESSKYDYRVVESTKEKCVLEFYEKDFEKNSWNVLGRIEYTIEDAKQQGLYNTMDGKIKHNYATVPQEMLFYRAITKGVSLYCPDIKLGMPIYAEGVEEWEEITQPVPSVSLNKSQVIKALPQTNETTENKPIEERFHKEDFEALAEFNTNWNNRVQELQKLAKAPNKAEILKAKSGKTLEDNKDNFTLNDIRLLTKKWYDTEPNQFYIYAFFEELGLNEGALPNQKLISLVQKFLQIEKGR